MQNEDVTKFRTRISVILGAYTFMWGLWLFMPNWDVFAASSVFDVMNNFMSETWWGLNAMLAGAILALGSSPRALIWGSIAGVYNWGVVGTLYWIAEWRSPAWITSYAIAFLVFGIYWLEKKELKR